MKSKKIKSPFFISFVCTALGMQSGCVGTYVMGDMPQTPAAYVETLEKSTDPEVRVVNMEFDDVVKKLKKVSDKCYQFNLKVLVNGSESHRDRYTGKVTKLSPGRAAFTLQEERTSGAKVVYANNDKPEGGMWNYAIVVEKTSDKVSTAKSYFNLYFYEDDANAVLDTVEGKYGDGCAPEKVRY